MKKKLLTLLMGGVMALQCTFSAFAAPQTVEGEWWKAWTDSYELKEGTTQFSIDVKGGAEVWSNVAAVFANVKTTGQSAPNEQVQGYKEYAVIRGDNWGWGGGNNNSVSGTPITYDGGIVQAADAAEFIATMKDCHIDAKVTIEGNKMTLVYEMKGANGKTYTRTATFTEDMSAGVNVFFVPDNSTVTVDKVEAPANTGSTNTDNANQSGSTNTDNTNAGNTNAENNTQKPADKPATTPATGDAAPVALFTFAAFAAFATVVVLKKKVNA